MPNWLPVILRKGCPPLFYSYIIDGYSSKYYDEIIRSPAGINNHQYIDS